jgi:hypothetical protein
MDKYYVYHYLNEDGTPYYVGKGKADRAFKRKKKDCPKPENKNLIKIIAENLSEIEAFELERNEIRKHKSTLLNKTSGGQGISGYIHTTETKQKIKKSLKGKMTGEKHHRSSKVIMIEEEWGLEFPSVREVAKFLNFRTNAISSVCRGERNHHRNIIFIYADDDYVLKNNKQNRKHNIKTIEKLRTLTKNNVKIIAIFKDDGIEFNSISECARELNLKHQSICDVLNNKFNKLYGYEFIKI